MAVDRQGLDGFEFYQDVRVLLGQLWLPNIIPEAWRKNFRVSRGFVYNLAEDTEVNARAPITVPFFANDRFLCGRAKTIQTQNQRALRASSFMFIQ